MSQFIKRSTLYVSLFMVILIAIFLTGYSIYNAIPLSLIEGNSLFRSYCNYFLLGYGYWNAIIFFHYPNCSRYIQIIVIGLILLILLWIYHLVL